MSEMPKCEEAYWIEAEGEDVLRQSKRSRKLYYYDQHKVYVDREDAEAAVIDRTHQLKRLASYPELKRSEDANIKFVVKSGEIPEWAGYVADAKGYNRYIYSWIPVDREGSPRDDYRSEFSFKAAYRAIEDHKGGIIRKTWPNRTVKYNWVIRSGKFYNSPLEYNWGDPAKGESGIDDGWRDSEKEAVDAVHEARAAQTARKSNKPSL